ncbi:serine/threonine dehydratase [Amycolatopsis sp. NBRC 101858]|uniref:threonine/serine dehydratase n=1 Tax=Amycolatopsis sp. NBRC 101858 TaxID=3032200 RepID=UPI0024A2D9DB|nr:threonine/serine dehydratase [Amycolatopsis sp. NBRC 101858]GLY44554.1 serine/threonine dehydratase [Amycolatopsis sp. NBRC 101858]
MTSLLDRIMDAHRGIRPEVPVSTLERSRLLSDELGCDVWLKTDHLMPTGSFKVRGSANKIRVLGDAAKRTGVITASTGNHGQGVARAGKLAGVAVTVYVGQTTTRAKMAAIEALGADLVVVPGGPLDAEQEARKQAAQRGKPYVAPYNDVDTVAGQGTLGVELAEQAPDLDAVFVCVGGGGLIGGVGTALKALSPRTRVVGVWPEASTCLLDSLKAGHIIETPESPTLSDGSAGAVEPGSVTFPICQEVIDETVTVSEEEIAAAMRKIAEGERWMIEGAAGVAVAGLVKTAQRYRGKKVAVVLCGRNVTLETFLRAVAV